MANITIGCRLPSGIILDLEKDGKVVSSVELAGQRQAQERSSIIILSEADYGLTEVDADFWAAWKKQVGPEFGPLKNNSIFEAKNKTEAKAKAKDTKDQKTGLEAMPQDAPNISKAEQ